MRARSSASTSSTTETAQRAGGRISRPPRACLVLPGGEAREHEPLAATDAAERPRLAGRDVDRVQRRAAARRRVRQEAHVVVARDVEVGVEADIEPEPLA